MMNDLLSPRTINDALAMLRDEPGIAPLAGGTDVFVGSRAGRYLDLRSLHKLRYIEREKSTLVLGALTTFADCIASRDVQKLLPILAAAAREIGGPQIQNRATLGGNIASASSTADGVPVLMAADAEVVLTSFDGERTVPLAAYYTGHLSSVRQPDELITEVRIALAALKAQPQYFRKVGARAANTTAKVSVAAIGSRVALGAVAPTVVRAPHVEKYLAGGGRDVKKARAQLSLDIKPIDDVRSTAEYRMLVAGNLLSEHMAQLSARGKK